MHLHTQSTHLKVLGLFSESLLINLPCSPPRSKVCARHRLEKLASAPYYHPRVPGAGACQTYNFSCTRLLRYNLVELMMLAAASVSYAPAMRTATRASTVVKMEIADKAGLEVLAQQLNPVVGYW